ncbi:MAG: hypothetical protein ACK6EB_14045, partial [Planctomyces sp.]
RLDNPVSWKSSVGFSEAFASDSNRECVCMWFGCASARLKPWFAGVLWWTGFGGRTTSARL